MKIPQKELINFIDYLYKFYGQGVGLYADDYAQKVTVKEIHRAIETHLANPSVEWGGGDSMDREAVAFILFNQLKLN